MANWKGRFISQEYAYFFGALPFVKGVIAVTLPEDLSSVDTTATFVYDGFYRCGDTSTFTFISTVPDGQFANGSGQQDGVAYFNGKNEHNTQQEISFIVTHISPTRIEGTYKSVNPSDRGTFYLEK